MSGITVTGNLIERAALGMLIGGGRHNRIEGNIFAHCKAGISADARGTNWGRERLGPILRERLDAIPIDREPWLSRYPELARIRSEEPAKPIGTRITGNAFVACGPAWHRRDAAAHGATLAPNFENLAAATLAGEGRRVTVAGTPLVFTMPEAGPRPAAKPPAG